METTAAATGKKVCFTSGEKWLENDSRFNSWAYKFTADDVNENKLFVSDTDGEFVEFDGEVALNEGEYLIVAAQNGSRNHHYYDYAFVGFVDGEAAEIFDRAGFGKMFKAACLSGRITSGVYTAAMKHDTARMLLWSVLRLEQATTKTAEAETK